MDYVVTIHFGGARLPPTHDPSSWALTRPTFPPWLLPVSACLPRGRRVTSVWSSEDLSLDLHSDVVMDFLHDLPPQELAILSSMPLLFMIATVHVSSSTAVTAFPRLLSSYVCTLRLACTLIVEVPSSLLFFSPFHFLILGSFSRAFTL